MARPRPELSADLRALKKSLASDIGLLGVLRRDEKLTGRPDPRTAALVAKIAEASREVKIRELIETAPPLPAEVRDRLARALAGARGCPKRYTQLVSCSFVRGMCPA